jgi:hypothetical protein
LQAKQHRIINKTNWRRLKIGFKVLLIMIVLALMIKFLSDLYHSHMALMETVKDQKQQLISMKNHSDYLQQQNLQLIHDLHNTQNQLQIEQNQLHTLQQHVPKLYINHKPVVMTEQQVKAEVSAATGVDMSKPTLVVGGLEIARQIIMRLFLNGVLVP